MLTNAIRKLSVASAAIGIMFALTAVPAAAAFTGTTEKATGVDTTVATLHGTVETQKDETVWWIAYGPATSESYESMTPFTTIKSGVEEPVHVSGVAKDLAPETKYHFVLVVFDQRTEVGHVGEELTFTTLGYHAAQMSAGEYPATISGSNSVAHELEFKTGEGKTIQVDCETVSVSGSLSSGTNSLSTSPAFNNGEKCASTLGKATVKANSCHYVFNVATSGPPYTGNFSISCSKEGDAIEVVAPLGCTLKVAPQTPAGSLSYETLGAGTARRVHATGSATGVKWTATPGCFISTSGENGVMAVDASLGGFLG